MDFKIGKIKFSEKNVVIIAEAGVNHLGKLEYAEKLIKSAAKAGADIIKFQTYKAKNLQQEMLQDSGIGKVKKK